MPERETFHWRHLAHYYPEDTIFFTTFRLAGSMPVEVIERLKDIHNQRKIELKDRWEHRFTDYDAALDKADNDIRWLVNERAADILNKAIRYLDGKDYDLVASCVMPNHVHLIIGTGKYGIFESVG